MKTCLCVSKQAATTDVHVNIRFDLVVHLLFFWFLIICFDKFTVPSFCIMEESDQDTTSQFIAERKLYFVLN